MSVSKGRHEMYLRTCTQEACIDEGLDDICTQKPISVRILTYTHINRFVKILIYGHRAK